MRITPLDLPLTPERIYERAQEIEDTLPEEERGLAWSRAIELACAEARYAEELRH